MTDILRRFPDLVLRPQTTIREAMAVMNKDRVNLVVVTDARGKLLGVAADIDVRRALLAGSELSSPIVRALNRRPFTLPVDETRERIAAAFRTHPKSYIPLVDRSGRLRGLAELSDYVTIPKKYPNRVVVMAGGAGKRLRPLTANTPKPMLRLGDKPILEHLVEQMATAGFFRFTFAVNYLAEQIRGYFGDGSRWGVEISYVQETKPLGTAGALSLLKERPAEPILVLNGDVLTTVDFGALLDFHEAEKGLATICVKHHEVQVPYGVIEQSNRRLRRFVEKPTQRFLVNAGIYVLDPRALSWVPKRRACDMPEFLRLIGTKRRGSVACFPMQEYWVDIGGHEEFRRAERDITGLFGPPTRA